MDDNTKQTVSVLRQLADALESGNLRFDSMVITSDIEVQRIHQTFSEVLDTRELKLKVKSPNVKVRR